jgi:hypothetical protein
MPNISGKTLLEQARTDAKYLRLTDAWESLRPHDVQAAFAWHPARFKPCPAGRRSGKTILAKRKCVLKTINRRAYPMKILIGTPSFTRTKDIYYEDLERLIPKHWIKYKKESLSSMEFRMHWGASIRLIGMNNPTNVEGIPWDHVLLDEFADMPKGCFEKHVRPALSTAGREGTCDIIGVPDEVGDNQAEYEKLWTLGLQYPLDPETCSFWWPSSDILSAKEIEHQREFMDAETFNQEVMGLFVRSAGKAFAKFDQARHVDAYMADYCGFLPIDHALDFGSRKACSLIGQTYRNHVWIMDEINISDSSTEGQAQEFLKKCGERGYSTHRVRVFGDAAGRHRSSPTGKSDYVMLADQYAGMNVEFLNLISNPLIKDTVNAVRSRLFDSRGRIWLWIHPRCKVLRDQLYNAPWPAKLEEWHLLAALRYYIYTLFSEHFASSGITGIGSATLGDADSIPLPYRLSA